MPKMPSTYPLSDTHHVTVTDTELNKVYFGQQLVENKHFIYLAIDYYMNYMHLNDDKKLGYNLLGNNVHVRCS